LPIILSQSHIFILLSLENIVSKSIIITFLCYTIESKADSYLHNYIFANGVVIALIAIFVWPSIINSQNIIYCDPNQQVCEFTNVNFFTSIKKNYFQFIVNSYFKYSIFKICQKPPKTSKLINWIKAFDDIYCLEF
jgi:hypothetical protein